MGGCRSKAGNLEKDLSYNIAKKNQVFFIDTFIKANKAVSLRKASLKGGFQETGWWKNLGGKGKVPEFPESSKSGREMFLMKIKRGYFIAKKNQEWLLVAFYMINKGASLNKVKQTRVGRLNR